MSFLVSIPIPPSVNAMYANNRRGGRGRYKTPAYKAWLQLAGWEVRSQKPKPVTGPYRLYLTLPPTRGDPDNRIKATSDLLVSLNLIPDDKHAVRVTVEVIEERRDFATVSVEAV